MTEPKNDRAAAELDAVDAALRSGTASATDPAERELQELALALRADSPRPDPAFAAGLRGRVEAGFPHEGRRGPRRALAATRDLVRRRPLPVLGVAASTIVALAVAGALLSRSGDEESVHALSGESAARPPSQLSGERAVPAAGGSGPGFSPGQGARRVERSAQLTLAAPGRRLDRVAAGIQAVTQRQRGYVLRSSLTTGGSGTNGGSFELRVPSTRLQDALRDLSGLATVRSRTQSGEDVTGELVSAGDRLASLRAERRSLLRRLARAGDGSTSETLRTRLDLVAGRIHRLRGQLRDLRSRTSLAAVTVNLERRRSASGAGGGDSDWHGTGAALDDALGSLVGSVNLLLRALGVGIPLGLLATALWLAGRVIRRRRREAALS